MTPVLTNPTISPSTSPILVPRQLSSQSIQNLATLIASASSSKSSLRLADLDAEPVKLEGLRHAKSSLKARQYKTPEFASDVFEILRVLHVPHFYPTSILPRDLSIQKVSGALTNAVFFVSFPSNKCTRTVLVRVYGPSSGSLISRPRELHILHILSSKYHIGPRIYGTFENGRVEQYFESTTLTRNDIRNPEISRWIAARMVDFHSVDIDAVQGTNWEIEVDKNMHSWLQPARQVLALPFLSDEVKRELDLDAFKRDWDRYRKWLSVVDDVQSGSRRVFAHNDTQYGNLLRLKHPKEGLEDHHQIIVVDFEYAGPNPASYDIANHFYEWTANYHSDNPHILDFSLYPTKSERRNFYLSYLRHTFITKESKPFLGAKAELEVLLEKLDRQVQAWGPASHGIWSIWAIVQAREDVQNRNDTPEFDYIGYARCRMEEFRRTLKQLGVL